MLCDPIGVRLDERSYQVHRMSKNFLSGCKGSVNDCVKWWGDAKGNNNKHCIIAHNLVKFDLVVIIRNLLRVDVNIGTIKKVITHYVDTLELFKVKEMWDESEFEFPKTNDEIEYDMNFKLGTLYEYVFNEKLPNAHTAVGDSIATMKLLLAVDPTLKYTKNCMKEAGALIDEIVGKYNEEQPQQSL